MTDDTPLFFFFSFWWELVWNSIKAMSFEGRFDPILLTSLIMFIHPSHQVILYINHLINQETFIDNLLSIIRHLSRQCRRDIETKCNLALLLYRRKYTVCDWVDDTKGWSQCTVTIHRKYLKIGITWNI